MIRFLLDHPDLKTVTMFVLLTKDQHHFYEYFGFENEVEKSMMLRR